MILILDYKIQKELINRLYLNDENRSLKFFLFYREIDKKITSYKTQDINKNKYNGNNIF